MCPILDTQVSVMACVPLLGQAWSWLDNISKNQTLKLFVDKNPRILDFGGNFIKAFHYFFSTPFFPVKTFLKKNIKTNFLNTSLHKFPDNFYYWLEVLLKLSKYIYKKNAQHPKYFINIFISYLQYVCNFVTIKHGHAFLNPLPSYSKSQ